MENTLESVSGTNPFLTIWLNRFGQWNNGNLWRGSNSRL